LGTAPAGLGAALAVVVVVPDTLRAAQVAELRAEPADIIQKVRSAAHECRSGPADLRAIMVQADTFGEQPQVIFGQAGIGAVLTLLGALDTSLDARVVAMMSHLKSPC
jgi:hypothetical protein